MSEKQGWVLVPAEVYFAARNVCETAARTGDHVEWINAIGRLMHVMPTFNPDAADNHDLAALGYTKHETDWQLVRGGKQDWRIVDAKISADGKHVWTKIEPGGGAHQGGA